MTIFTDDPFPQKWVQYLKRRIAPSDCRVIHDIEHKPILLSLLPLSLVGDYGLDKDPYLINLDNRIKIDVAIERNRKK